MNFFTPRMVAAGCLVATSVLTAACPSEPENSKPSDPVVATINKDVIRLSEIEHHLHRFRQEQGDLAFRSEEDRLHVRDRFLADAIDQRLLLQAAEGRNIEISDKDVDRALARMRAGYPGRRFEEQLVEESLPESQMRVWLKKRIMIQRLLREDVNARVAVSPTEVQRRFDEHKDEYVTPEQVRASQIVVRTAEEAERIRAELLRGGDFADLARRYSIAPEASRGGDLGLISRGVTPNPIDSECFSLSVGRLSEVVESHYGYHLFKVFSHEKQKEAELDAALRSKIEEELRQEKETVAQGLYMADLKKNAVIQIDAATLATLR